MSKAEEQALKAYPAERGHLHDRPFQREGFVNGYEQAGKDLALTWEDIQRIVTIADLLMVKEYMQDELNKQFIFPEAYYTEVLNRFNKSKEEK